MASAASQKRVVSSVFITLTSPQRASVTQQQAPVQAHHAKQNTTLRFSSSDSVPTLGHIREEQSKSSSHCSVNNQGWICGGVADQASEPQSFKLTKTEHNKAKLHADNERITPPGPKLLGASLFEDSALPAPPPPETLFLQSHNLIKQPVSVREVGTSTPSSWFNQEEQTLEVNETNKGTSRGGEAELCGFCRKPIALSEPAIEALNRTYHDSCFQCRSCNISLAGKCYYNKSRIPFCEECYQASLELCWSCGEMITDHIIRALERPYHPPCFTCTTCKRQIGEQAFAQGEVGEIYCLPDYYRKYAPKCSACGQLIIPKEDGTDSYTFECMGRSYHENCFRCEVCVIEFPNDHSCYPLDGKLLCKTCHTNVISEQ